MLYSIIPSSCSDLPLCLLNLPTGLRQRQDSEERQLQSLWEVHGHPVQQRGGQETLHVEVAPLYGGRGQENLHVEVAPLYGEGGGGAPSC